MGPLIDLSDIVVSEPDGTSVRLGEAVNRPTIIDLVRYYGCAPCRDQLVLLADSWEEITARGGGVLGIGPRAPYQARMLTDKRDIPFPLLLDPEHGVANAVGLHRQSALRFVFDLKAWFRWVRAFFKRGQGKITGAYWETPGIVVVDAACRVRWMHRGKSIGDYPALQLTIQHLDRVIADD